VRLLLVLLACLAPLFTVSFSVFRCLVLIGDLVNTAARIGGTTKDAHCDVHKADATRVRLSVQPDDLVEHATLPVRGRTESDRVWSLRRAESDRDELKQPRVSRERPYSFYRSAQVSDATNTSASRPFEISSSFSAVSNASRSASE